MKSRNIIAFICIYVFLAAAVGVFFNPALMKDLPQMEVYNGPLEFSGEKAYDNLKILTGSYSKRVVGTDKASESAEWVGDTFKALGMKAYKQEFDCDVTRSKEFGFDSEKVNNPSGLIFKPFRELSAKRKGYNVIGISKGTSDEVVAIGAHRDMVGSVQGAEDNGSGTATMLELARVLSNKEHFYTYAFVSFDGEEAGLKGSEYFIKHNKELKIKAAVVLDMVGFKDANALSFYQDATARGATPLWTTALSNNVLKTMNLWEYDFGKKDKAANPTGTFLRMLAERSFGIVNTDSGAFIDMGIPSIGLKSIQIKPGVRGYQTGRIHEPSDTLEQISPESLEASGKFVEKYVQSINTKGYNGELKSNMFITYGSKYVPPIFVWSTMAVLVLMMLTVLALQLRNIIHNSESFMVFIRHEKKWLVALLIYSILVCGFWQLFRFEFMHSTPVIIILILYFISALAGAVIMLIMRFRSLKSAKAPYHEVTAFQRNILNIIFIVMFFILSAAVNPFAAVSLTLIPALVLGRVSYRNEGLRIVWILGFVLWSVIHLGVTLACVQSYIFDLASYKLVLLSFSSIAIWVSAFMYIISAPPMPRSF